MTSIFKTTGVTLTELFQAQFGDPQIDKSLQQLASLGIKTVTFQWQTGYSGNGTQVDRRFASEAEFAHAVQYAKSLGLRVELRPQIFGPNEEWSGTFKPSDPAKWFDSYGNILVDYAKFARKYGADALYLTNEGGGVNTDVSYLPYWTDIVARVRGEYSGQIGVNAMLRVGTGVSPSDEVTKLTYGNLLDFIGLSMYSPLTSLNNPTRAQLEAAWSLNEQGRNLLAEIEAVHAKFGKPVKISEFSVAATDGANITPYAINTAGTLDYAEPVDVLYGTLAALAKTNWTWFNGIDFWGWYSLTDPVARFVAHGPSEAMFQRGGSSLQDNAAWLSAAASLFGGGSYTLKGTAATESILGSAGLDSVMYQGARSSYKVAKVGDVVSVTAPSGGVNSLLEVERIQFSDKSVNLTVGNAARSVTTAQLDSLIELYIAYINRVPDADGMVYWISQLRAGQTLNQIGDAFYGAALQFSALTGYTQNMTNGDFVAVVYKNVLGRSAPDAEGLAYWSSALATGAQSRGNLVSSMLSSAHTFKGNAQFGYVADLLDNKISVGKNFAIANGLVYNSSEDSIVQGMAVAAAVTSTSTEVAIGLVGVTDGLIL